MDGKDNHAALPASSMTTANTPATATTGTATASLAAAPTTIVTMVTTDEAPAVTTAATAATPPPSEKALRFRMPTGDIVHHRIHTARMTVSELKALLATETVPATRMRLVRGGQVLQDDACTLEHYQLADNDTIYVARGAQNETPAITPEALSRVDSQSDQSPHGMGGDPMGALMEAPFMKSLMSNSNFMREMIMNHPQMKKLAEENIEVAHMLRHPELFEASRRASCAGASVNGQRHTYMWPHGTWHAQTIVASQKPQIMREMLRNNDRALSNIEAMPGGFNHLRQMYKGVQEPLMEAERPKNESTDAMNRAFAMRFNITSAHAQADEQPNSQALPNPWKPPHQSMMQQPRSIAARDMTVSPFAQATHDHHNHSSNNININNTNTSRNSNHPPASFLQSILASHRNVSNPPATSSTTTTSTITTSTQPPSIKYTEQLEKMRSMGFTDDEKNTRALSLTGGDLNGAIEWLVNYGGENAGTSRSE
ncbi:hypothetical protein SYNPS1DRAFT_27043 [Syncephalis pseudoplumigaleata]|uniref:UBA domain-containing protein n=1 Tax=Syncephalis pseudoplumigaleata TaxID=1712513 RepID=A0A4P9Z414_9FUNG|nr:hypothetical protein SYNPS1DRAFT_27043 [Syncephalis pseudoplumigaleata]|eukprot:RKP27303.1 hypothetical protein SYNPS1DRAFT_27043 [Syncephalis pseudoplumigaleata]